MPSETVNLEREHYMIAAAVEESPDFDADSLSQAVNYLIANDYETVKKQVDKL